jgi:hypothetical protein
VRDAASLVTAEAAEPAAEVMELMKDAAGAAAVYEAARVAPRSSEWPSMVVCGGIYVGGGESKGRKEEEQEECIPVSLLMILQRSTVYFQ